MEAWKFVGIMPNRIAAAVLLNILGLQRRMLSVT